MSIFNTIRCRIGIHSWGKWEFVNKLSDLQVSTCLHCPAQITRDVLSLCLTSPSDTNIEIRELSFVLAMLEIKPSTSSENTDSYGSKHSETVELSVIHNDGTVQQLNTSLGSFSGWQTCRFFVIRTSWVSESFWQQQRDGNLEGFDTLSGVSIGYTRIPTQP